MQVRSLVQEDPLEKGMGTHSLVFLPGESHGQRSLQGPWGRKDLDTTEHTHTYKVPYLSLILLILLSLDSLLLFFFLTTLKIFFIEGQTSSVEQ